MERGWGRLPGASTRASTITRPKGREPAKNLIVDRRSGAGGGTDDIIKAMNAKNSAQESANKQRPLNMQHVRPPSVRQVDSLMGVLNESLLNIDVSVEVKHSEWCEAPYQRLPTGKRIFFISRVRARLPNAHTYSIQVLRDDQQKEKRDSDVLALKNV